MPPRIRWNWFSATLYLRRPIFESIKLLNMRDQLDPFLPTRQSLLSRLKDWDNHESWQDFFDTYWRLIYGLAVKSGLSNTEAEDVVQEVLLAVAKEMPDFKYDPARGSFKGWLDVHHPRQLNEWAGLFKVNFVFTGREIVREFLISTGYLPGAHDEYCPIYKKVVSLKPGWTIIK